MTEAQDTRIGRAAAGVTRSADDSGWGATTTSTPAGGAAGHGGSARSTPAAGPRTGSATGSAAAVDTGTESPSRGRFGSRFSGAATNAKSAMRTAAADAESNAKPVRGSTGRQPRRARLTLSHINVYSVFKYSCVLAIALFFVWLIVVGALYGLLDVAGVFNKINTAVQTISGGTDTKQVVTGSVVFGGALLIGVANIVIFIALSTVGAMIYNLCADLVGGVEVTLSERD